MATLSQRSARCIRARPAPCAPHSRAGWVRPAAAPPFVPGEASAVAPRQPFDIHTQKEAEMARLVRKNVFLDPRTLARARRILGKRSESEAIREALELVAF